jgi:hypothetical protein
MNKSADADVSADLFKYNESQTTGAVGCGHKLSMLCVLLMTVGISLLVVL